MRQALSKGAKFYHKRILDVQKFDGKSPQLCVVTKIAQGVIYYRCDYGQHDDGTPWTGTGGYFPIEQLDRWVGEVVS